MKKKLTRVMCSMLGGVIAVGGLATLAGCSKKDSIVIMTEEMSGLFNPFYATSGSDQDVIGMTQIGMLSTDKNGKTVAGDDLPTVVKAFDTAEKTNEKGDKQTVYTFVIKNNIKFSDGVPLTMNDVFFNMYEYLDPVYTGSSTMYSIDIEGLSQYRTQTNLSAGGSAVEENITRTANAYATLRKLELIDIFEDKGKIPGSTSSYSLDEAGMRAAINEHSATSGYKSAVATNEQQKTMTDEDYRKILLADYDLALKTFKEELHSDYAAAKESFDLTTAPYDEWKNDLKSDIFKFFVYEGYITPVYEEVQGKKNENKILRFENTSIVNSYKTEDAAVDRVYGDNIKSSFNNVLTFWGTAGTLLTQFAGAARDVLLHNNMVGDTLMFPNISGIRSLGHTMKMSGGSVLEKVSTVKIKEEIGETEDKEPIYKETEYKVATSHNEDGTPVNNDEYDVLQITVNGTDPKAIYNFGFTVAPAHYYTASSANPNGVKIDIENNEFGVEYSSSSFQSDVIQSQQHVEVPVGAGPYMATDSKNGDNPSGSSFWSSNVVYFKANKNFMFEVKAEKLRLQVVSSSNALDKLQSGEVDYVTPQFTQANSLRLRQMEKKGFKQLASWQLGYGYIGINAGKVPDINIRRAIMAAMQTSLALDYYETGTCRNIDWPMSMVGWAYPFEDDGKTSKANGHDYTQWTTLEAAKQKIEKYMGAAGASAGDSRLKIKFTIAGSSITEHPTYAVFKQAREILNSMGWQVEVKADSRALTKLATGSLEVWAAAWGSTIDPDMYQVYHKNSSATSVYAWGYREILASPSTYAEEYDIITGVGKLSDLIDDGRSTTDQEARKNIYEQAMGYVLDLAVELPVYQRTTLYAYNEKTLKGLNDDVNPYSSPLERVWELELA